MARTSAAGFWSQLGDRAWSIPRCLRGTRSLATAFVLLALAFPQICRADPIKGEPTFSAAGGYARLVIKFTEDVGSQVTTAGSIIVIRFEKPVDVPVDKLAESVPDYISSARRDPDGMAIRMSLARRVTVNTMAAGERVFVDFLPESWTGPPPSLPLDVVRELAERARVAERALRMQRAEAAAKKKPPVRVRALVQPTFVRFVFELPDGVGVSSVLNDQKLTLQFGGTLTFDLADAKVAAPPNIASINQKVDGDMSQVEIALIGDVDVHSFREEKNYIVDVSFQQSDKKAESAPAAVIARAAASASMPAKDSRPPQPPGEIAQPTSEAIAQQMKMAASNPEPAAKAAATQPPSLAPAPPVLAAKPSDESATKEAPAAASEPPRAGVPLVQVPQAEAPPKAAVAEKAPPAVEVTPAGVASVDAVRDSEGLRLMFSFGTTTPAASFRRGDTVWVVFDSTKPLDLEPIRTKGGAIIGEVRRIPLENGQALRIRLNRPLLHSLTSDERASGENWTLAFADKAQTSPQPLMVVRNIADPKLANVAVPLTNPGQLHRLLDPDAGDTLMVVTALPPSRGFIKRQDFVDFSLLDSVQGVAIRPNSDNVAIQVTPGGVTLAKAGGLTLSAVDSASERAPTAMRPIFDVEEWQKNQAGSFLTRERELMQELAAAEPERRPEARLALARFYISRGFYVEAKGACDMVLQDPNLKDLEPLALMAHAVANLLIDRPDPAWKDMASPAVGNKYDSQLWKAFAYARQHKWAEAREKFKNVEFSIAALPLDLQRIVTIDSMQASLEVKDYAGAAKRRAELEVIGLLPEMKPKVAVLRGRLAEGLGQERDALDEYKFAIASPNRQAAAEAKLLEIRLRKKRDEINQADMLSELETLSITWRGDAIEVQTLQMLAQIYSDTGRYAESLTAARTATKLEPNSDVSRQAQDDAAALFSELYLSKKGDDLPPIDALGMFYEFRELTPIGRRGDEMIRRLADRLVGVDLLDQAAELLQYQVDHRLEGAARAQVAAKLAMVYLTNRKPDKAIAALRSTRIADLSGELRQQRLLLEARAQSDIGRYDLALEIISNISGREAIRLRSDIYWAARRWRESAEQIELYYGDRYRDFKPLNSAEKSDVIRAAVGYALAEDAIGMARFREKYAALMSGEADKTAFDVASKPAAVNSGEFSTIAKMAASVDTLDGFIRDMKTRFPDATARATMPPGVQSDPVSTGSLPAIVGVKQADATR